MDAHKEMWAYLVVNVIIDKAFMEETRSHLLYDKRFISWWYIYDRSCLESAANTGNIILVYWSIGISSKQF